MINRIKEFASQARADALDEKHYLERVHNRELEVEEYQDIYDVIFAKIIAQECASLVYKTCENGDIDAQHILYEFDVDGARSQK